MNFIKFFSLLSFCAFSNANAIDYTQSHQPHATPVVEFLTNTYMTLFGDITAYNTAHPGNALTDHGLIDLQNATVLSDNATSRLRSRLPSDFCTPTRTTPARDQNFACLRYITPTNETQTRHYNRQLLDMMRALFHAQGVLTNAYVDEFTNLISRLSALNIQALGTLADREALARLGEGVAGTLAEKYEAIRSLLEGELARLPEEIRQQYIRLEELETMLKTAAGDASKAFKVLEKTLSSVQSAAREAGISAEDARAAAAGVHADMRGLSGAHRASGRGILHADTGRSADPPGAGAAAGGGGP